jgi:hypothetical protein
MAHVELFIVMNTRLIDMDRREERRKGINSKSLSNRNGAQALAWANTRLKLAHY